MISGLDQKWNMFSPHPPSTNWWINIKAELVGNETVELFNNEGIYRWKKSKYTGLFFFFFTFFKIFIFFKIII